MKLHITTNTKLDLSELAEFNIEPTVLDTTLEIVPKYNPYFTQMWGDFDFVRSFTKDKYDARCFITSADQLKAKGITTHIGMYDMIDNDGVLDFYVGIPSKLDAKSKANGFKTDEARIIVHEMSHGLCQKQKRQDVVHTMQDQGRLKELWEELYQYEMGIKEQLVTISLLDKILSLLGIKKTLEEQVKKKPNFVRPTVLTPLVERKAEAIITAMAKLGHAVRLVEGYRSFERQTELYNQGRTTKGDVVTNAKAGESYHNYGVAVDFVFRTEGYDASIELWELLGSVGKSQGFNWGGDWTGFTDRPHFELTLDYKLSDFQEGKVDYNNYA